MYKNEYQIDFPACQSFRGFQIKINTHTQRIEIRSSLPRSCRLSFYARKISPAQFVNGRAQSSMQMTTRDVFSPFSFYFIFCLSLKFRFLSSWFHYSTCRIKKIRRTLQVGARRKFNFTQWLFSNWLIYFRQSVNKSIVQRADATSRCFVRHAAARVCFRPRHRSNRNEKKERKGKLKWDEKKKKSFLTAAVVVVVAASARRSN